MVVFGFAISKEADFDQSGRDFDGLLKYRKGHVHVINQSKAFRYVMRRLAWRPTYMPFRIGAGHWYICEQTALA